MKKTVCALGLGVLMSSAVMAAQDLALNNFRKMGMGNAGVAVVSDDSALYVNPAGLDNVTRAGWQLPAFRVDLGTDFLSAGSKFADLSKKGQDSTAQTNILKELVPFRAKVGGGATSLSHVNRGFGVGGFGGSDVMTQIVNSVSPKLKMNGNTDMALAVGGSQKTDILGQPVVVGVSGKYISRAVMYNQKTGADGVELITDDLIKAVNDNTLGDYFGKTYSVSGFGVDVGILTPFSFFGQSGTFGAAIRNLGATLTGTKKVDNQADQSSSIALPVATVLGVGMTPDLPFLGDVTVAVDYHLAPSSTFFKSLYMGAEKSLGMLTVRGGLSQGYPVMGVGLNLFLLQFDYVYFSQELGEVAGQTANSYHAVAISLPLLQ